MSTEHITIDEALRRLRAGYPGVQFMGGEQSTGAWIAASAGPWSWARMNVTSPLLALASAKQALDARDGS